MLYNSSDKSSYYNFLYPKNINLLSLITQLYANDNLRESFSKSINFHGRHIYLFLSKYTQLSNSNKFKYCVSVQIAFNLQSQDSTDSRLT